MIKRRAIRTGDGTHHLAITDKKKNALNCVINNNNNNECGEKRDLDHFWGWDDPDMIAEDKQIEILHKKFDS